MILCRRGGVVVTLLFDLVLAPSIALQHVYGQVARAQTADVEVSRAEGLIQGGIALRQAGNDVAALALFTEAYNLEGTPRARAQMALAEFALSRWFDAEEHLREALAAATDPWIVNARVTLDEAYASVGQHIARLVVLGPLHATVTVSGENHRLPLAEPIRLEPGTVSIVVRASGYEEYHVSLAMEGGGSRTFDATPLLIASAPAAASEGRNLDPGVADVDGRGGSVASEPLFWLAVVGGALLVGVSVTAAILIPSGEPEYPAHSLRVMTLRLP